MSGLKWVTGDVITFARMNQKTLIIQSAEPAIMYIAMMWLDIDDDTLYQRNAANGAWTTVLKVGDAPTAHHVSHEDGGADEVEIDDLPGANGAAGEIVESDGDAMSFVEPDGRYDPKAHILGTAGPHTGELPLIDLEAGAQGEIIIRTGADWVKLGVGTDGQVLISGGVGADVYWGSVGENELNYSFNFNNLAVDTDEWLAGGDGGFSVGPVFVDDEPSLYDLETAGANGNAVFIHGNEISGLVFSINEEGGTTVTFEARIKLPSVADVVVWFGLINPVITNYLATPPNSTGFYREAGNWFAENENGGGTEQTDTGVAPDTGWHTFKIVWDALDILYYIDDVLKVTHSTTNQFPLAPVLIHFLIQAGTASDKHLYLDWVTVDVT